MESLALVKSTRCGSSGTSWNCICESAGLITFFQRASKRVSKLMATKALKSLGNGGNSPKKVFGYIFSLKCGLTACVTGWAGEPAYKTGKCFRSEPTQKAVHT